MNVNMEFNTKFDNEDYIITIQSNNADKLTIVIEQESNNVFWKKELSADVVAEITTQMGSYKSLEIFTKMLIFALKNENENITLNFCSLNEIQMLSENKRNADSFNASQNKEDNIKKYLMLIYTQFEKVVYPIQLEYLDKHPETQMLYKTISRLKTKLSSVNNISDIPVNFNEYEKLKKENTNLINKIKLLETYLPKGAVDNDDIYKNYSIVSEEYEQYKKQAESRIKMLLKSIEDLKSLQNKENKSNIYEKDKNKNTIKDLETKLNIANDMLNSERRQSQLYIEEKNKQIETLKKEIKTLKETEKINKAKITRLENDLKRSQKASDYYRYGTPKSTRSYKTTNSNNSYTSSYCSGFSRSKMSNVSYIKKNLIPSKKVINKPFKPYKAYDRLNYMKSTYKSSKPNSIASRSKSKGASSVKSGSASSKGKFGLNNKSKYSFKPSVKSNSKNKNISKKKSKISPKKDFSALINSNKNNNKIKSNESINVTERLGRLQELINKASKK